jgi:predicted transcriptional regulator
MPTKRGGKPLTVYLSPELWDRLEQSAQRMRRTKTAQVTLALEAFLDAEDSNHAPPKKASNMKKKGGRR